MDIIGRDEKTGGLKVRINNLDDLWVLKNIVKPGDVVKGRTHRREETDQDLGRSKRGQKKPVTLTIEVEKVEFHRHSERLRLLGIVKAGEEDAVGNHHTINLDVGKDLWIFKTEWRDDQVQRIRDAETEGPEVGVFTVEEGEAFYGLVRGFGIDKTFTVTGGSGKRFGESGRSEFFGDAAEALARTIQTQDLDAVIVAGPGFTKEDFADFFRDRYPEHEDKIHLETCSGAGPGGVHEVMRRGAVDEVGRESRLSEESSKVEELLEEVATEGKATYGPDDVARAVEMGAVETLLVTDEKLRTHGEIGDLIQETERMGGDYLVVSSEYEPGTKLDALGGVAALLKFRIE